MRMRKMARRIAAVTDSNEITLVYCVLAVALSVALISVVSVLA
jgi:hypothetical protein